MARREDEGVGGFGKNTAGVAQNHLQSAYIGLQKSLQQEWSFMQRVTPCIGDAFVLVEQALRDA